MWYLRSFSQYYWPWRPLHSCSIAYTTLQSCWQFSDSLSLFLLSLWALCCSCQGLPIQCKIDRAMPRVWPYAAQISSICHQDFWVLLQFFSPLYLPFCSHYKTYLSSLQYTRFSFPHHLDLILSEILSHCWFLQISLPCNLTTSISTSQCSHSML